MDMPSPVTPPGLVRSCERHGIYVALECPTCLQTRLMRERRARGTVVLVLTILLGLALVMLLGGWPGLPPLP